MSELQFSLAEIFSLIGLCQCVYLLVHMLVGKTALKNTFLPMLYFAALAGAFFFDAAQSRLGEALPNYFYYQWALWFIGPPLSVLVILQIADPKNAPPIKEYWVLLLLPLSFVLSHLAVDALQQCKNYQNCAELRDIMNIMGFMSGAISLLLIFSKHGVFKKLKSQKSGRERYWLILALMFLNALFLGAIFLNLNDQITASQTGLLKTLFGVAFAYLVSTILFRALPSAPKSQSVEANYAEAPLSDEEERVLKKVKSLLTREKIYQEAAYSRTDLAQECGVSESVISRVINVGFQKSFPQLMNEYRIEDAKNLLTETRAPIKVIAGEVGFNSLPSFNRAFKELTDISPTQYRKNLLKT